MEGVNLFCIFFSCLHFSFCGFDPELHSGAAFMSYEASMLEAPCFKELDYVPLSLFA